MTKRKPAVAPAAIPAVWLRTISVELAEPYAGWRGTFRRSLSLNALIELQSGDLGRIVALLDARLLEHNFPDGGGGIAASLGDVEPLDAISAIALAFMKAAIANVGGTTEAA